MFDKSAHKRENICVICGGCQYKLVVPESVLHRLRHIVAGKVCDNHLGTAVVFEFFGQLLNSRLCMTVNRGISNDHALAFGLIG